MVSRPMRARGLKLAVHGIVVAVNSRAPCGREDCNLYLFVYIASKISCRYSSCHKKCNKWNIVLSISATEKFPIVAFIATFVSGHVLSVNGSEGF